MLHSPGCAFAVYLNGATTKAVLLFLRHVRRPVNACRRPVPFMLGSLAPLTYLRIYVQHVPILCCLLKHVYSGELYYCDLKVGVFSRRCFETISFSSKFNTQKNNFVIICKWLKILHTTIYLLNT